MINLSNTYNNLAPLKFLRPWQNLFINNFFIWFHFRNSSKASYLPRKSHEKNSVDPDQGWYRSTPGDSTVNHSLFSVEILPNKTNLPDVLPLTAKYQSDNDLFFGDFVTNNQFYSTCNKQTAVPQSAPVLTNKNLRGFFSSQFSTFDNQYPDLKTSYNNQSYHHSTHFVETCTQPYTTEALHNLTHPRDAPPPYVDETEQQIIQHLEFMPTIATSQLVYENSEKSSSNVQCPSELSQDNTNLMNINDVRLPSYAEIQNQLENLAIVPSPSENCFDEINSTTFTHNFSSSQTPEKSYTMVKNELSTCSLKSMVMVETASQTDSVTADKAETCKKVTSNLNRLSLEEIDCEKLSQDLVSQLSPSDKLHQLLGKPNNFTLINV